MKETHDKSFISNDEIKKHRCCVCSLTWSSLRWPSWKLGWVPRSCSSPGRRSHYQTELWRVCQGQETGRCLHKKKKKSATASESRNSCLNKKNMSQLHHKRHHFTGRTIMCYCVLESLQCNPHPWRWQSFLCQVGQRSAPLCQQCDHLWSSPEWPLLPDGRPAGRPSPETPARQQVTFKLHSTHLSMTLWHYQGYQSWLWIEE